MKLKKFNFKTVKSTNDIAIRLIKNSKNKSGMIVADKQNNGRGRHGKKWISFDGNLFVSIFFSLEKINYTLKQITRINCILVKKLLSIYCKKKITIKEPNDLLINKKKICGILQEIIKKSNKTYMIVGIGVNLIKSPNIKNYPTTNLFEITNKKFNKKYIILHLKDIYENFIEKSLKLNLKNTKNI